MTDEKFQNVMRMIIYGTENDLLLAQELIKSDEELKLKTLEVLSLFGGTISGNDTDSILGIDAYFIYQKLTTSLGERSEIQKSLLEEIKKRVKCLKMS